MSTELKSAVCQLSIGIGLIDCANFDLVAANPRLETWLQVFQLPAAIDSLIPELKVQRLHKVVEKKRKYRSKHEISFDGLTLHVDFSFSNIRTPSGGDFVLIEGVLDETRHEVDVLIKNYQETMENYKKQLVEQKRIALEADRAKTIALSSMNEKLEAQVKLRTRELEQAKLELSHQANHDPLTGLANRRLFEDRLQHALELSQQNNQELAVFYLDLDKFKEINDTYGHRTGDEVLIQVAQRLRESTRNSDTIARMGGDEFSIILENTNQAQAEQIASKILASFLVEIVVRNKQFNLSTSIGICMSNDIDHKKYSITQAADAAMYEVKLTGKNNFSFSSEGLISELTEWEE